MLTTLSIGTVLAFLLTGLIIGAFTRSENVNGSPISTGFFSFSTQSGQNVGRSCSMANSLGVLEKIQREF